MTTPNDTGAVRASNLPALPTAAPAKAFSPQHPLKIRWSPRLDHFTSHTLDEFVDSTLELEAPKVLSYACVDEFVDEFDDELYDDELYDELYDELSESEQSILDESMSEQRDLAKIAENIRAQYSITEGVEGALARAPLRLRARQD